LGCRCGVVSLAIKRKKGQEQRRTRMGLADDEH
jgi:hypothetical protein